MNALSAEQERQEEQMPDIDGGTTPSNMNMPSGASMPSSTPNIGGGSIQNGVPTNVARHNNVIKKRDE